MDHPRRNCSATGSRRNGAFSGGSGFGGRNRRLAFPFHASTGVKTLSKGIWNNRGGQSSLPGTKQPDRQPSYRTRHLLLGILRTDDQLALRLLKTKENIESIGRQIHKKFPPRKNVSISVHLPLSVECKRMLANGAEEAERRNAGHIEPQHCYWDCCAKRNAQPQRSCWSMEFRFRSWRTKPIKVFKPSLAA